MMKLHPSALAAAAAAAASAPKPDAQPDMDAIQREAALKMPIKDAMREVSKKLVADLDAALQVAVERFVGHPVTDPEPLRGRLTHIHRGQEEGTTYYIDGVAVLWAGPITMEREGDTVRGRRDMEQLR